MTNNVRYILARIAGLLLMLIPGVVFVIQLPGVQRRISDAALDKLNESIGGHISAGAISFSPSGALHLEDLLLLDDAPYCGKGVRTPADTILYIRKLDANFSVRTILTRRKIHINRVTAEGVDFHLVTETETDDCNITNLKRILGGPKPRPEEPKGGPELFTIRKIRVNGIRFRHESYLAKALGKKKKGGMNYLDLDLRGREISGHSMKMSGGIMQAVCDHVDISEKSGYTASHISGSCRVGMGKALIENIRITDPWSEISIKSYCKTYKNASAFRNYVNKVRMEAEILPTRLSMTSLYYLTSGGFKGNTGIYDIKKGTLKGYVSNARAEDFTFTELTSGVSGKINGHVTGLPMTDRTEISVRASDLSFSGIGALSDFLNTWGARTDWSRSGTDGNFVFNGKINGPLSNLRADGVLNSDLGNISAEAKMLNLPLRDSIKSISGKLTADRLDAGRLTGKDFLGKLTFGANFMVIPGKRPEIKADSVRITALEAFGYTYKGINASATYRKGSILARLNSRDPNLRMKARAALSLIPDNSAYKIEADIAKADLHALHFDNRGNKSGLSLKLDSDLKENDGFLSGKLNVSDIMMENDYGSHDLGSIVLTAGAGGQKQDIRLTSSFLDAFLKTEGPATHLFRNLKDITLARELPALMPPSGQASGAGRYELGIHFHDTRDFLSHILPGLYISENSEATASVDENGDLTGSLRSACLAYGTKFIRDADVSFDNLDGSLNVSITGSQLQSGVFSVEKPELNACAKNNGIYLGFLYDGIIGTEAPGELYANLTLSRDRKGGLEVTAKPFNSHIKTGNDIWSLGESEISFSGKKIKVNGFSLQNAEQGLFIDGILSPDSRDTLSVVLDNLDLAVADCFVKEKTGLRGRIYGKAYLTSAEKETFGMLMNLKCDSLGIYGHQAGNFRISSVWDDEEKKLSAYLTNTMDGRMALQARGSIVPSTKTINASATMENFSISPVALALRNVFSDMDGSISGNLDISGKTDNLSIKSNGTRLNDLMFRVALTGVPYVLDGPFSINDDGIFLDGITVKDSNNGSGELRGAIKYRKFKDIRFDTGLDCTDLTVFDSGDRGDETPYGHLSVSGSVKASGLPSSLMLDGNLTTSEEGDIHIPLSGSLSSVKSNLLTFVGSEQEEDPYEQMLKTLSAQKPKARGDLQARASLNIEQGVKAYVEIDKAAGNVISFGGNGRINVDMRPSKEQFNLNGSYNISEGNYHFVLPGILAKDFEIQDGSSLTFGGDLKESQINITAVHKLRASLSSLISDSTTVANRRLVECGLNISNRLKNPNVRFFIDVPDLDPSTKSQVESALNTEDKIQKQFISLLLVGSFVPSENSGVFNSQSVLLSNVSEIMSNQLNSVLQRLEIPLDFGFDYQGYQSGANIFDVAVSTQLFKNRVVINGSLGNRKYKTTTRPNGQMVGNLDIEIKLDKPGRFRMNIFSHAADEYTNFLDNTQRNGLGFSYQKEFSPKRPEAEDVIIKIKKNEQGKALPDTLAAGRK